MHFNSIEIGVGRDLTSMVVLDEGVDIPSIKQAYILSSSTVKREKLDSQIKKRKHIPIYSYSSIMQRSLPCRSSNQDFRNARIS